MHWQFMRWFCLIKKKTLSVFEMLPLKIIPENPANTLNAIWNTTCWSGVSNKRPKFNSQEKFQNHACCVMIFSVNIPTVETKKEEKLHWIIFCTAGEWPQSRSKSFHSRLHFWVSNREIELCSSGINLSSGGRTLVTLDTDCISLDEDMKKLNWEIVIMHHVFISWS